MAANTHVQSQLRVAPDGVSIQSDHGADVATVSRHLPTNELRAGTARRLVACWNACDGLSTENLEQNVPVKDLATRYNAALAQRDELLQSLKAMMDNDCPLTGNPTHDELIEHWEYEKSEGRGDADIRITALRAIAKAGGAA